MDWHFFQFNPQYLLIVAVRLLAACVLGGIIGFERELTHHKPAGFRTHILVSLGSCLVMLISEFAITAFKNIAATDPTRIGAQVVSGIGFLGAGAIIRHGISVKGITTAASIWAVACVGLACGIGFYSAALLATILIWAVLIYLKTFEQGMRENEFTVTLYIESKDNSDVSWDEKLKKMGLCIESIDARKTHDMIEQKITCKIDRNNKDSAEVIARRLMHMDGVLRVSL